MDPRFEVLPPGPPKPKSRGGLFGVLATIGAVLFKFAAPLLIFLKTGGTMLFSILAYTFVFHWTWQIATGIVVLIFVHEMGHVVAAKWLGMPVSAPLFIPFVGATIMMKQSPRDAWSEALMAYGGPLAGCIGSWFCYFLAFQLDQGWLLAVAYVSFLINLFNLIPIPPLDGGRICAAVSAWFWIIGLVLLGAAILHSHSVRGIFLMIFILIIALARIRETLFGQSTPEMKAYYATHISKRLSMALMYVALIAVLLLGYWDANQYLSQLTDQS